MTLRSMTGFARVDGHWQEVSWTWELRAVNGKGLDIRLRLPSGFERLETPVRTLCKSHLSRGNVQATLSVSSASDELIPRVNPQALKAVLEAISEIDSAVATTQSSAAEILSLRGVMVASEGDGISDEDKQTLDESLLGSLADALIALNQQRGGEGEQIAKVLLDQVEAISEIATSIEKDPSISPEAIREKLQKQVAQIAGGSTTLDADRLYQEAVLLATKADNREELDRLGAHVIAARSLISEGSPVGRKLEFLAQEFNREANTLCSKANAISVTEQGLAVKVIVDQFREQVLNVE